MKKIMTIAMAAIFSVGAIAQDKVEGTVGTDVVSRYVWRGQEMSDAAVEPTASLSWKGLTLGAWGSLSFMNSKDPREFDLTLSYAIKGFNVGVTDYWFSYYGEKNKYFEYRSHESEGNGPTSHVWEGNIGYDFGPVSIQWYTNFAGADGMNKSGHRAYSSYFEVSAPFRLVTCDWKATIGAVPYATTFYADADGFAVTKVALRCTREIPICKRFSLPVFGELSANPSTKKGFLVVGFTIAPFKK